MRPTTCPSASTTARPTTSTTTRGALAASVRPARQQLTNVQLVNPTFVQTGRARYRLASVDAITTARVYARPVESCTRRTKRATAREFDQPYETPKALPAKGTRAYERHLERELRHAQQERDELRGTFWSCVIGAAAGILLAL